MKNLPLNEIIEWDIENWSKVLPFWEKVLPIMKDSKILLIGERNGGLTLWMCLKGYNVISSDYFGITPKGLALLQKFEVCDHVELKEINMFSIPYPNDYFDIVLCKSVIGGLKLQKNDPSTRTKEYQAMAIDEVQRVLKQGGYFLGAENMEASFFHKFLRKKLKKDIGWRYLSYKDLRFYFRNFNSLTLKSYGFIASISHNKIVNSVIGYFNFFFNPIIPRKCKYIGFIIAKK